MDFVAEGGICLILTLDFINFGGFREFRFLDPPLSGSGGEVHHPTILGLGLW